MKLVKREHACLVLTQGTDTVIVDPGSFTLPLSDATGVVAIVITHEHPDHWTPEHLDRIIAGNPDARLFGPAGFAAAARDYDVTVVADGDTVEVGEFSLAFYGEKHAVIHESIPVIDNVGVLVNGALWYGGDSFTVPPVAVETVAVPAGAPWLKIGEVMDYVEALAPKRTFPTHEMVLSVIGKGMANQRIESVTKSHGGEHFALEPGESLDL
jgi:L-ascorbate metabolism protein UlaG (beta-lactamase superfamily)